MNSVMLAHEDWRKLKLAQCECSTLREINPRLSTSTDIADKVVSKLIIHEIRKIMIM